MTLGQKLRQTRLSKGLSQSQVAGDCVTRNMLSQIENDQASPSMAHARASGAGAGCERGVAAVRRADGCGNGADAAGAGAVPGEKI